MTKTDFTSLLLKSYCAMSLTEACSGAMPFHVFCSCDLDLDPMTFIYELDLTIPKTHLQAQ